MKAIKNKFVSKSQKFMADIVNTYPGEILEAQDTAVRYTKETLDVKYNKAKKLDGNEELNKIVRNCNLDSLGAAQWLLGKDPNAKPVILGFANKDFSGGNFFSNFEAKAQEEDIYRRTTVAAVTSKHTKKPLKPQKGATLEPADITKDSVIYKKPIAEQGCDYANNVLVIKDKHGKDLKKPYEVAVISSAAYNVRYPEKGTPDWDIKQKLDTFSTRDKGLNEYREKTKEKIRAILKAAVIHGHRNIVLGAFGCGQFAYRTTTPDGHSVNLTTPEVAKAYAQVLKEPEFNNYFYNVIFAFPGASPPSFDKELYELINADPEIKKMPIPETSNKKVTFPGNDSLLIIPTDDNPRSPKKAATDPKKIIGGALLATGAAAFIGGAIAAAFFAPPLLVPLMIGFGIYAGIITNNNLSERGKSFLPDCVKQLFCGNSNSKKTPVVTVKDDGIESNNPSPQQ